MDFLGLGVWEILVILVMAMLVFGPAKLPEIARTMGKTMREFRKATASISAQVTRELEQAESAANLKKVGKELKEMESSVSVGQIVTSATDTLNRELRDASRAAKSPLDKGGAQSPPDKEGGQPPPPAVPS